MMYLCLDEFLTSFPKRSRDGFIKQLEFITEQLIKRGIFRLELKMAKIMPIYKAKYGSLITNYGLISVL